jgi:DNA-binding Lrp family transcriptional regulator
MIYDLSRDFNITIKVDGKNYKELNEKICKAIEKVASDFIVESYSYC